MDQVAQQIDTIEESEREELPALLRSLRRLIKAPAGDALPRGLILLNTLILFIRPQNNLPILSSAFITIALFLCCFFFWLIRADRNWTKQTKWMFAFIFLNAGFIVLGKLWDPFIVNDGVAFATWKTLVQTFFCFLFPIVTFFPYGRALSRLIAALLLPTAYLAVYAMTHGGTGPGDFVNDENDLCLVLVLFLPFAFYSFLMRKSSLAKILALGVCLLALAGIVATGSRGGFVGLVCCLAYIFAKSPHKLRTIFACTLVVLLAAPFVPPSYWHEMRTITETREGTAQTRRDYWRVAFKMWADPANIVTGVGLGNAPWRLHEYEGGNQGFVEWSMGGRQVHSLYFQLLPDLGIVGLLFFGTIVGSSYFGNRRAVKDIRKLQDHRLLKAHVGQRLRALSRSVSEQEDSDREILLLDASKSLTDIAEQAHFLVFTFAAVNAAWIGFLCSATFISVLYYPPLWFLAVISATLQLYWTRLQKVTIPLLNAIGELSNPTIPKASVQ